MSGVICLGSKDVSVEGVMSGLIDLGVKSYFELVGQSGFVQGVNKNDDSWFGLGD